MESLTAEDPFSVGGYELCARLGQGGFGRVYLGLSPGGRAVAVKVLQPEWARDHEFLHRFRLEVAAAQQVNGIYTAPVVASGLDDRPPWVATAFVAGPSLDSVVTQYGPLPEPALWRLLAGLVEALQAIHACGLVHRDLKPANVMLASDGPRVIDFGISKALDATAVTSTGTVFGTPAFMAPEQAEGRDVSPASDVFSLGCVLAYAATGILPFGGGSAPSILYRVVHADPVLDGAPPQLRGVISWCLSKAAASRPDLADLARIGRDGPGGRAGQPSALFWPPQVGRVIRDYQDKLEAAITARVRVSDMPGRTPQPSRDSVHTPTALWVAGTPQYSQLGTVSRPVAHGPGHRIVPAANAHHTPPGRHGFGPSRRGRHRKAMIGGAAALLLVVAVGTTLALKLPGASKLSPGSGTSAAADLPLPPAEVLVLGSQLTPINAATHAVGKPLPFGTQNEASGETGSTQMAFVRTSRGLIAYVLSDADVVPVNVATNVAGKPIKIGDVAAVAASPDGRTVYVAVNVFHPPSSHSGYVTPIDTATNKAGRPIPVGASPTLVAFAPDGQIAYVVNGDNTVTPINVATGRAGPPIPVGANPDAIVFTPDGKTAYVGCNRTITPINVATGTAETAIPVGGGWGALAITPDGKTLYALNGDSVTPIDTATNTLRTSVSLSSRHMTWLELLMAPNGKTLYAMDQQGDLTPVDTQTNTAEPTVNDGEGYAIDMAITPDGKTIYLTNPTQNTVIPYDTTTRTIGKPISLAGSNPNVQVAYFVAVAP